MTLPAFPRKAALIVDDEPAIVAFIAHVLEENGYLTRSATTVPAALQLFAASGDTRPTLAVLDIAIHKDNGITLAHQLLQQHPSLAILFISGYVDDLILLDHLPEGTRAAFLQKVFTADQLLAAIDQLLVPVA